MVKVIYIDREPRNGFRSYFCDSFRDRFKLIHRSLNILVLKRTMEINIKIDEFLVLVDSLRGSRLDACHVNLVVLKYRKCIIEYSRSIS